MAGGKTISENYAFAGMHHIFDQHTAAGKKKYLVQFCLFKHSLPISLPIILII